MLVQHNPIIGYFHCITLNWGWFQLETPVVAKWWLNLMAYYLSLSNQANGTLEII